MDTNKQAKKSRHNSTPFLQRTYYSNVIIVSKDGNPLTTVSTKKANWYLKKKLGKEIPPFGGYPRAIKLNFDADVKEPPKAYNLGINKDQCVICGREDELTLHHVIPYVLRRHFPKQHKEYSRQWCVLVCWDCHQKVEDFTQPHYKENFPQENPQRKNTNLTLQMLKFKGHLNKLAPEKLQSLLERSDYKTVGNIPRYRLINKAAHRRKLSSHHKAMIRKWALWFIKDKGGVRGTKAFFRSIFLQMNPRYLPEGYLEINA